MCLEKEVLIQLVRGELSADAAAKARQHLAVCRLCRKHLDAVSTPDGARTAVDMAATARVVAPSGPDSGDRPPLESLPRGFALGRYVIIELIAKGGMGVVYSAYDPELDRRVAIKLLRPERVSPDAHMRLLREAQAIARLSHPNVVSVFDVGTAGDRLFIAEELVLGQTLRQWMHQQRRTREILAAFLEAGKGLAAAHDAGLIHRDFKPDNVLVGNDGRVRVMDFGLARSSSERADPAAADSLISEHVDSAYQLALDTPLTQGAVLIGTPGYMAPEQLTGNQATPLSDQFSFCVSLYEALCGCRPFRGAVKELRAQIESGQLQAPVKKVSIPSRVHRALVRGLAAHPNRRHPTMSALLAELQSRPAALQGGYLWASVAVLVCAVSVAAYVYRKNASRSCESVAHELVGAWSPERREQVHRALTGSGKSFAEDTWKRIDGTLNNYATAWERSRVRACRAALERTELPDVSALRALCLEQRLTELKAAAEFLSQAEPEILEKGPRAADHLSPVADCDDLPSLASRFKLPPDPLLRAQVETIRSKLLAAKVRADAAMVKQALAATTEATTEARKLGYMPLVAEALLQQGTQEGETGNFVGAERILREALRTALAEGYERVAATACAQLVFVVGRERARYEEAHVWAEQAAAYLTHLGGDKLTEAALWANEGVLLAEEAKYDDAARLLSKALAARESAFGSDHPDVAHTLGKMSYVDFRAGRYPDAIVKVTRQIDILRKAWGPRSPNVAGAMGNLALFLMLQERFAEALGYFQQTLSILEESEDPDGYMLSSPLLNLGYAEMRQGLYTQSREHLERARRIYEKTFGPEHVRTCPVLDNLGALATVEGNYAEAIRLHQRSLAIHERTEGPNHPNVAEPLGGLADVSRLQGKFPEAMQALTRALTLRERTMGADHSYTGETHYDLGRLFLSMNKPAEAIPHFERALAISRKTVPDNALQVGERSAGLGEAHLRLGKPELARPLLERACDIGSSGYMDPADLAEWRFALAKALWPAHLDRNRAVELAQQALEGLAQLTPNHARERREVSSWLNLRGRPSAGQ